MPFTADTPTRRTIPNAASYPPSAAGLCRMERKAHGADRLEALYENLMEIALRGTTEANQLAATIALLNRLEGLPVARNVNMTTNSAANLSDDELADELHALASRWR